MLDLVVLLIDVQKDCEDCEDTRRIPKALRHTKTLRPNQMLPAVLQNWFDLDTNGFRVSWPKALTNVATSVREQIWHSHSAASASRLPHQTFGPRLSNPPVARAKWANTLCLSLSGVWRNLL